VFVTPRPDVSVLELLDELAGRAGRGAAVDGNLAESLEQNVATLRMIGEGLLRMADGLERMARRAKGEAAQHGADEERLAEAGRQLKPARERARAIAVTAPRASRRPRLEESDDKGDRDRAAAVKAALLADPSETDYAIGRRCNVHHEVVARLRKGLRKVSETQEVRGKGFARDGPASA
jgi:hypothetical protein